MKFVEERLRSSGDLYEFVDIGGMHSSLEPFVLLSEEHGGYY